MNNVMFDYRRSGSRYTTGIENRPEEAADKTFQFQFVGNYYLNGRDRAEIFAERKHGESPGVSAYVAGNIGPHRRSADDEWNVLFAGDVAMRSAADEVRRQVSARPLFQSPMPVPPETAEASYERSPERSRLLTPARRSRPTDRRQRSFTQVRSRDSLANRSRRLASVELEARRSIKVPASKICDSGMGVGASACKLSAAQQSKPLRYSTNHLNAESPGGSTPGLSLRNFW
ncbi:MAG: hypothetical protein QM775_32055 [Pirellulales bacterium]